MGNNNVLETKGNLKATHYFNSTVQTRKKLYFLEAVSSIVLKCTLFVGTIL